MRNIHAMMAATPNQARRGRRPNRFGRPASGGPGGADGRFRLAALTGLLLICAGCAPPARLEATPQPLAESRAPARITETADAAAAAEAPPAEPIRLAQAAPIAPAGGFMANDSAGRASSYWGADGRGAATPNWRGVAADGFHDPNSDAVAVLQNPRAALSLLPRSNVGNFVDWVQALRGGAIRPRAEVKSAGAMRVLDLDVVMAETKSMPTVTFPHAIHTEWLSCENCHDRLFPKSRRPLRMADIFRGQACGSCHGKVAFPPLQCFTCHNGPRKQASAE